MVIKASGRVGIGTSNPTEKLEVSGNMIASGTIESGRGGGAVALTTNDGGGNAGRITVNVDSTTGASMSFQLANNLPVGVLGNTPEVFKIDVDGNAWANNFLNFSDRRLKQNIHTLSGLDIVKQLRGVSFNWKKGGKPGIGFIAQEVETVLPNLVTINDLDGIKSVQYANITALLVEAIKEQQQQIEVLQTSLEALKQ